MRRPGSRMAVAAVIALLGVGGCRRAPEGWTPVLEQTSTSFLQARTEKALEKTRTARRMLPGQPQQAIEPLDEASALLEGLLDFYLPIFEARELTYNAYRELYLGRPGVSAEALAEVESILQKVAKRAPRYYRVVKTPLEHAARAKLAVETDSLDAQKDLNVLATELNFLVLKGDLVLSGE